MARQGWPSELLHYAYQRVGGDWGKVRIVHILACPLAVILATAIQCDIIPDPMKSSIAILVFEMGEMSETVNHWPIANLNPQSSSYTDGVSKHAHCCITCRALALQGLAVI